jgi:hypothetical protein
MPQLFSSLKFIYLFSLFIIYLAALLLAQAIQRRTEGCKVSDE